MSKFFVSQQGSAAIRLDQIKYVETSGDSETPEATVYFINGVEDNYLVLTSVEDIADLMKELRNVT